MQSHKPRFSGDIPVDAFRSLMVHSVEQSSEAIVITEANLELPGSKIIYANAAASRMSGYSVEELLGKTPRIFQGPKTDRSVLEDLKSKLRAGEAFKGRTTNCRKDGSEYIVDWSVSPVVDQAGEVTHYISTQRDVTAELEYIKKIERNENFLKEIGNLAKVGGWQYNKQTGELLWTDQVYKIHGMNPGQAIDVDAALSFYINKDRAEMERALSACLEEGVAYDLVLKIRNCDGEKKWVRAEGLPMRDEGRIIGAWGVFQDITEMHQRSEDLEKALQQAQAADEAKRQFLMMMSHELRTPLNPILGISEILAEDCSDPQLRDSLNVIASSAQHLATLIGDVLDVAGISLSELNLAHEPFPVAQAVARTVDRFRSIAEEKGLDFEFKDHAQLQVDPPLVCLGDERKFLQVLVNILSNAVKFTREGRIDVELLPPEVKDGEASILIRVSDSGIGIDPEQYEAIFNPFQQVDMRTTRDFQGQGLGLHLSREIAQAMGGNVRVSSQSGEGSVFELSVKLEVDPAEEVLEPRQNIAVSQKPLEELRVLVAEDEPNNCFVISQLLQALEISYELVEDGEKVLDILSREDFDLILMDLRMPNMNGIEATRKIRQGDYGVSVMRSTVVSFLTRGDFLLPDS